MAFARRTASSESIPAGLSMLTKTGFSSSLSMAATYERAVRLLRGLESEGDFSQRGGDSGRIHDSVMSLKESEGRL